ncbi:hypothetical protein A8F94_22665 [Bacillus sp. FJAT-27225]|uniref:hypothetical protein n=1 Tax=Bacillus sp. FJAT-27225 TaxID=1743144 RepID=UPI00080C3079|nr:hypothetical protein [Bacillus sp. FJAT-27225]OCA81664.1 hypothetical protein A8F94_22665 [Bacillus sp. FJAT-27225]
MADFFWTIYLGVLGTASIAFLIKGQYKTKLSKLDFVISIITWIGLFGFVTETDIFNQTAWKIITVAAFIWDFLFAMFLKGFDGEEILEELSPVKRKIWMLATFIIMLGPLYYGLFNYAFL